MSNKNGDKSRYHRQRRQKTSLRLRNRELAQRLTSTGAARKTGSEKSK